MNFILYTHSDYSDVWPIYFGQMEKYFPNATNFIFVNAYNELIPKSYITILYDDKLAYRERMASCLKMVKMDYCIFQHEDMFLYNTPNYNKIIDFFLFLDICKKNNSNKYFIKLIKGGNTFGEVETMSDRLSDLRIITKDFDSIFAIQPTIWNYEKLREVYCNSNGNTIWEFEVEAKNYCIKNDIMGYYVDDGSLIRKNSNHYDNKIYPYVATGIVKGKWNSQYLYEISELFKEYNIESLREWV